MHNVLLFRLHLPPCAYTFDLEPGADLVSTWVVKRFSACRGLSWPRKSFEKTSNANDERFALAA